MTKTTEAVGEALVEPGRTPPLGTAKSAMDTPALCVDLDAFEANIQAMADYCRGQGVAWRPHSKCHKSSQIARQLVAAGAIGVTCAKLGEAEVMARGGIRDLLIANLIVGPAKLERLARLCGVADPLVCIDHLDQARPMSEVLHRHGRRVRVLIEVDIGLARVGVLPGAPTLELARELVQLPGLELAGIMGYEGHLLTIDDPVEKARRISDALDLLIQTRDLLKESGIACEIVSCGGTGSYRYAGGKSGITEIQAGGAIFMDVFYRQACQVGEFADALSVLTTVVGRPAETRAIIDAGRKTLNAEIAQPRVKDRPGLTVERLSAEHGELRVAAGEPLRIGDQLELIPGYSDLTCVLHNHFYGFRGDRLEVIWPLEARGYLS